MRVPEPQPVSEPAPPPDHAAAAGFARRGRVAARAVVRRGGPFAGGIAAALVAWLAYGIVAPAHPLTRGDVADEIASALASVTPPPPWSEVVYQAIAPSLVIVEASRSAGASAEAVEAAVGEASGAGSTR